MNRAVEAALAALRARASFKREPKRVQNVMLHNVARRAAAGVTPGGVPKPSAPNPARPSKPETPERPARPGRPPLTPEEAGVRADEDTCLCDHDADQHEDGTGACMVATCNCSQFTSGGNATPKPSRPAKESERKKPSVPDTGKLAPPSEAFIDRCAKFSTAPLAAMRATYAALAGATEPRPLSRETPLDRTIADVIERDRQCQARGMNVEKLSASRRALAERFGAR